MKRTKKIFKIADAILCSDFHLREDVPICRTDDYDSKQWSKVTFISNLQKQYNCPVLHAGDLFDHWKPSPELLSKASANIPDQFYTIYGQHDLPQHNLELVKKSGIYNLQINKKLQVLNECHWGQEPKEDSLKIPMLMDFDKHILVWHIMNYQGNKPWPGCTDPSAAKLLRKYPRYDLICTGDNHKPFVEEYNGRLLVNPGSLMRMDADQVEHRPRVYLWYADTNTVEPVYIPIEKDVVSREHIERHEERDSRIDAFVESLNNKFETSLSFEDNLEQFMKVNTVRKTVKQIIYKAIE